MSDGGEDGRHEAGGAPRRRTTVLVFVFPLLLVGAATCAHRQPGPLHPRAVELQIAGANALRRGELDRAAGQFALALEYEPRMAEAENGLGLVALRYGDRARAAQHFRAALALDEELAEAHLNLGGILQGEDLPREALDHFRAALAIDPGYVAARLAAAEVLLRLGRLADARWELAKACEAEPGNAAAQAAHALVLARLDRVAAAEGALNRALELDGALPAAFRARAEILRRRGDHAGAEVALRFVLRAEGGTVASVEDRLALGTVLAEQKKWDAAADVLTAAALVGPRNAQVRFALAFVELGRERPEAAIIAATQALELRPLYPEARLLLAEAWYCSGDARAGERELRRFIDEAPPEMEVERTRARALLAGTNNSRATLGRW